ncbi:Rha family transcriptional regulator [Escherichia coli]|uniref:Rha family transcriptional regulator n=2 Tax=Escherichia coli TaxID=562 RepID=UPI001EFCAC8E|nr:Rha family transcriptional regulator [Escherichia coli]WKA92969.1 Rha family transcriptional regulator [Escherichia coli]
MGPTSVGLVPLIASCENPVQSTASELLTSSGGYQSPIKEAAIMATISPLSRPSVTIENGNAITTSIDIAEFFEKQHHHVVQKIESLECSEQFLTRNFSRVKFEHRGNTYNAYQITKNGFVFLVIGFTGKKAAAFKEAYIAEFDRMEKQLWEQKQLALSSPAMNINYPLSWFSEHHPYATMNYVDRKVISLDASVLFDMPSPTMRILNELHSKGYNVDAAVAEFNAFKHLTEEMRRTLQDISRLSDRNSRKGFSLSL